MELKTVEEIVKIDIDNPAPKNILENFIKTQEKKYNNIVGESQRNNIETLAKLLYYENCDEVKVPIIVNIPMGEGKSCLLVEFIKYLYNADPNFGAIVVKKTLDECNDFCVNMNRNGSKKEHIALTVRGFNFKDCKKYNNIKEMGGAPNADSVDYDYRLCKGCLENCLAKKSKTNCKKYRILAISHARLFLSNSYDQILDDIRYFEQLGMQVKRKLLIIDEKIDMCDISSITDEKFNHLKEIVIAKLPEYIDLFTEITEFIDSLEYPEDMNKPTLKQTKFFRNSEGFKFEPAIGEMLYEDTNIKRDIYENLLCLERILDGKYLSTSIPFQWGNSKKRADKENKKLIRAIHAYRYIDLAAYSQNFDKTVILDATAYIDYDYSKSKAVICSDIWNDKREIKVYVPYIDANASKSKLVKANDPKIKNGDRQLIYYANISKLASECKEVIEGSNIKTLIVVYKEFTYNTLHNFKEDITNKLLDICKDGDFEIIHHGQFTTGVNKFTDYERVIIIGQLNKSSSFYETKCLSLERKIEEDIADVRGVSHTEMNDYLISNIQQIGRTAYRNNKIVDVYFIGRLEVINCLLEELKKYFNLNINEFENKYYFQESTKQDLLIRKIQKRYELIEGTTIKKSEIYKLCNELNMCISNTRQKVVKDKLLLIGIVGNPQNNREYLFTKKISDNRF